MCKRCNALADHALKRAGLGKTTDQLNPSRKRYDVSLRDYGNAIKVMRGQFDGDVAAAVRTIRAASPSLRSAYTKTTWSTRRKFYGPGGRQDSVPF